MMGYEDAILYQELFNNSVHKLQVRCEYTMPPGAKTSDLYTTEKKVSAGFLPTTSLHIKNISTDMQMLKAVMI